MTYVRQVEKELQRYDRFLRIVRSIDEAPGQYLIERKTAYYYFPDIPRGTDRARRWNDGYRRIMAVGANDLCHVRRSLELSDIQRLGGAEALHRHLTLADDRASELADRAGRSDFDAIGSDMYDRLAWAEGRRVSMGGHGG